MIDVNAHGFGSAVVDRRSVDRSSRAPRGDSPRVVREADVPVTELAERLHAVREAHRDEATFPSE